MGAAMRNELRRQLPRDFRSGVQAMLAEGWQARTTKKGILFLAPGGTGSVMLHRTPGDHRAAANFQSLVRRLSRQAGA